MNPKTQSQIDIELHLFGQRMRAMWAAKQTDFEKNIAAFREGVREDWEQQRTKIGEPKIEGPEIEAPKIEGPKIEPPAYDTRDRKPEEPDLER